MSPVTQDVRSSRRHDARRRRGAPSDPAARPLDGGPLTFILTPGRHRRTGRSTFATPAATTDLTSRSARSTSAAARRRRRRARRRARCPPAARTRARPRRGSAAAEPAASRRAIRADGDVLASWPTGMSLPWGVGYTGNVWLGDPIDLLDVARSRTGGDRDRRLRSSPTIGEWGGDMAFDTRPQA